MSKMSVTEIRMLRRMCGKTRERELETKQLVKW